MLNTILAQTLTTMLATRQRKASERFPALTERARWARVAGSLRAALASLDSDPTPYPRQRTAAVEAVLEALEGHALHDAERACAELDLDPRDRCFACAARFAAGQHNRCDDCASLAEVSA